MYVYGVGRKYKVGIQQRVTKKGLELVELTRTLSLLWARRRKFTNVWSSHPFNYCQQKSGLEISKKFVVHKGFSVHVREYPKNDQNFSIFCRELSQEVVVVCSGMVW